MMPRISGVLLVALAMLASIRSSVAATSRLDEISLPTGFFPEGITLGRQWTAYVGSIGDGSIWKGDLSTGAGEVVVTGSGDPALGLDYDRRSGYLFVAGGTAGTARVYDENFDLVADLSMAGADESPFVNDVIITDTAAYFTDSYRAKIFSVELDADTGELVDGPDTEVTTINLSENFPVVEGSINANGIVASDDGSTLIVVNMSSGELFTVDPATGIATAIDLGGAMVNGDGLVLRKNTLWAIDNGIVAGARQISEVSLSPDLTCGSVSPRVITNELFDFPTTAARKGNSLYVVNAKFGVAEEDRSTTEYSIVRVDRDEGEYVCSA